MMKMLLSLCVFILPLMPNAYAQKKNNKRIYPITIKADTLTVAGEKFRITYTYICKDSLGEIVSPEWNFDDSQYTVSKKPCRGTQTNTSMHQGKITTTKSVTYHTFLTFPEAGTYGLPPMTARKTDGEILTSGPASVRVLPTGSKLPGKTYTQSINTSDKDIVKLEVKPNKNSICLGDSIDCELRLYFNINVTGTSEIPFPIIDNARCRIYKPDSLAKPENTKYNGTHASTVLLGKYSITPIKPGKITIAPINLQVRIRIRKPETDPFEAFFHPEMEYEDLDIRIQSDLVEIEVIQMKE